MTSHAEPTDFLPLRPVVFGILAVLREQPRHGYAIMQLANDHVGRRALLGPGTLYRTLKELRADGLLEHAPTPRGEDARRQYYRLSALGSRVADAETERLRGLIEGPSETVQQPAR